MSSNRSSSGPPGCDVAIVGLGPVGAVLGNLLGAAGVSVAIFERDADIIPTPRAVLFDAEIMRVFQSIGLADAIEPALRPSTGMQFVDPAGNVLLLRAAADTEGSQGWRAFYNFHQPSLEGALRAGLDRYPTVSVHLRHEVFAVDESPNRVSVRVEDMASGGLRTVSARFVIGCDGARSLIRRLIGGGLSDLGMHEPWVVADFVLKHDPGLPPITTQYCDPVSPSTYVHVVGNRRRWEFKAAPGVDLRNAANPDRVWALARRWISPEHADLERAALYTFHSLIAERWRRDRLLVAGDAAHQTPPFLGQGLCAGIRDAANLAWKLIRVLQYQAPDSLLDTYGPEREAHANAFIQMAVHLGKMLTAANDSQMRALAGEVGSGAELVYPTPSLGQGIHHNGGAAGVIAPQPRFEDRRRLDDDIGYEFGLIVSSLAQVTLPAQLLELLDSLGVAVVSASGQIEEWLTSIRQTFVLLRPDRYVLAATSSVTDLQDILLPLERALGVRERSRTSSVRA
jgi:3-(3-hydroxy-phenyl)propionate hydroxylase